MFASATKLGGVADSSEGCAAIQRELDTLERWIDKNFMKFSKGKCKVWHLGKDNSRHRYKLGSDLLESSYEDKSPGVLADKLTMSQWCAFWTRRPVVS